MKTLHGTKAAKLVSRADLARLKGCHRSQVTRATSPGGPLHDALVHGDRLDLDHPAVRAWLERPASDRAPTTPGHISRREFAARAGVSTPTLAAALEGELAPAANPDGTIDACHVAALTYLAKHPFSAHEAPPEIDGAGYVYAACVFGKVDLYHPAARAYCSRVWGVPATDAEIARRLEQ